MIRRWDTCSCSSSYQTGIKSWTRSDHYTFTPNEVSPNQLSEVPFCRFLIVCSLRSVLWEVFFEKLEITTTKQTQTTLQVDCCCWIVSALLTLFRSHFFISLGSHWSCTSLAFLACRQCDTKHSTDIRHCLKTTQYPCNWEMLHL
jgi:hypothetical protein